MNQDKSRNFGHPHPFFHGEIALWKKCGNNVSPAPIGLSTSTFRLHTSIYSYNRRLSLVSFILIKIKKDSQKFPKLSFKAYLSYERAFLTPQSTQKWTNWPIDWDNNFLETLVVFPLKNLASSLKLICHIKPKMTPGHFWEFFWFLFLIKINDPKD